MSGCLVMVRLNFLATISSSGLLLVAIAAAWIIGILLDSALQMPPTFWLFFCLLFFVLIVLFWHREYDRLWLLLILCIAAGAFRYAQVQPAYNPQSLTRLVTLPSTISVRGKIADEPKIQARTRLLRIDVEAIQLQDSSTWIHADGKIEAITLYQSPSVDDPYGPNYGDSVKLTGKIEVPTFVHSKNIVASMPFPRISTITASNDSPLESLLDSILGSIFHLRHQLATLIAQALPQPAAAILIAIFLGLRTPALQPLAHDFNITGTAHLITPSGFTVTLIFGLVANTGRLLLPEHTGSLPLTPLHRSWRDLVRLILLLLSVAFYTILSGAGPATIRAWIMGSLLVIAPRLGRKYNIFTGLALAALLMSCHDPFVLWETGFLLSFLATLGIVLLTPYLRKCFHHIEKIPGGALINEQCSVSIAAQIATLPIIALTFHEISLMALIANILTVPLFGWLILLGLLIGCTGFLSHPTSLICGWIAWPFLWYLQVTISFCANQSWAPPIPLDWLDPTIAWIYYACISLVVGFLLHRYPFSQQNKPKAKKRRSLQQRRWLKIGCAAVIIAITGIITILPHTATSNSILFFNIDVTKANGSHIRGEAILIRTQDGKTLLIDGGNDIASLSQHLDAHLPPWQRRLDMVILTNPQPDSITGLQDVLLRYDIGEVIDAGVAHPTTAYARWRRTVRERNLPYTSVTQGDSISLGKTTQLRILWPRTLHSGSNEVRDNSLIFQLVMPKLTLLLLGSAIQSNYALNGLLTSIDTKILKSDVIQVLGNMNTPVSSKLESVFQHVKPALLIITSATQRKGSTTSQTVHSPPSPTLMSIPHPQTLQTSQLGTLEIQSDQNGWNIPG
jgi:competence protein ComEC